jgi:DNA-binding CsgD family transcriptional regulator
VRPQILALASSVVHEVVARFCLRLEPQTVGHDTAEAAPQWAGEEPPCRTRRARHETKRLSSNLQNARVLSSAVPVQMPRLTEREVEVLRWTAEGKVSVDISDILGITERTVNFHICNCMKKLGATSKTSAAVQAALWGLI